MLRLYRSQVIRLVSGRFCSSKVSVGARFQSIDQIKEYLEKPTWSIEEYLGADNDTKEDIPSKETVLKLLQLSGLPSVNVNIEDIQERLTKQVLFIKKLQESPIEDENINTQFARLMPRETKALNYKNLLNKIEQQKDGKFDDEISDSWDSLSQSSKVKNGYFVVDKKKT